MGKLNQAGPMSVVGVVDKDAGGEWRLEGSRVGGLGGRCEWRGHCGTSIGAYLRGR